ncbi:MAG: hypothetical protein AB1505_16370 [Candidatus Latescibacterota bacterium]
MLRLILLALLASVLYRTWQRLRARGGRTVLGRPTPRPGPRVHVDRERVVDAEYRDVSAHPEEEG